MDFLPVTLISLLLMTCVDSIMFYLEPNQRKCLKEELRKDVVVSGEYEVGQQPGQHVYFQVTDTRGHILQQQENAAQGKIAFVSDENDVYEVCFISKVPPNYRGIKHEVTLATKHGAEAKNYDQFGQAAKLKPMEVELRRLEDLSASIVNDFAYMRQREEEMRDTNESTNSRVLYFSVFSMCCLLGLATWQVLYLRRFFKAKKLID